MKDVRSSETSVRFSLTSRRHIDEQISLHNILFSLCQTSFLGNGKGSDEAVELKAEISTFRKYSRIPKHAVPLPAGRHYNIEP
jgi:hypothetical protein